jgi:hypothetical protein
MNKTKPKAAKRLIPSAALLGNPVVGGVTIDDGSETGPEFAQHMGISERAARKILRELIAQGKVRVGRSPRRLLSGMNRVVAYFWIGGEDENN